MNGLLKRFILWDFSRETTVYVLFCLLIVAFIFLTPKSWFDRPEKLATQTSKVIVQAQDYSPDRAILQGRVREICGDPDAEIVGLTEKKNANGETVYEIEIK